MKCPACKNSELRTMDRKGIDIVYCPNCRGTWLQRDELDKVIERSDSETKLNATENGSTDGNHYKKKKRSILGDLFDF